MSKNLTTLLAGINLNHKTLQKIRYNRRIAVSVIGKGIAGTIHGGARVIKEKIAIGNDVMVEVKMKVLLIS